MDWGWIAAAEAEAERLAEVAKAGAVTTATETDFVAKLLQLQSMLDVRLMRPAQGLEKVAAARAKAAVLMEQAAAVRARAASLKAVEVEAAKADATRVSKMVTTAAKAAVAAETTRGGGDREPASATAADKAASIAAARAHEQRLRDAEARRVQELEWRDMRTAHGVDGTTRGCGPATIRWR
jgi:hypothetical protein